MLKPPIDLGKGAPNVSEPNRRCKIRNSHRRIQGRAEGVTAPIFFLYFQNVLRFCFENRFMKMLFHSIFRNVNDTLRCITNTPQCCKLHVLKSDVFIRGWGVGRIRPTLSEFSRSTPDSLKIRAQYNVEKFLPGIPGVFDTIVSRGRRI